MDFANLAPTQPAKRLNPEAGDHPVTADPAALEACAAAIERTYARYPYYQQRYGDRGRSFSRSDSGWLVTVADLDDETSLDQVLWLGRVLSGRGMPRRLLEVHLGALADELEMRAGNLASTPARARRLRAAAAQLRGRREAAVPAELSGSLAEYFEQSAPADERERHPRTGELLLAAVADERDGLARAVPSLVEWIGDPERFSQAWVRAVQAVVNRPRHAVSSSGATG